MPSDPSPGTSPATLLEFVDWLKLRQAELWDVRERSIGGSGIIALATGRTRDDPGPANVEVRLHQPSPEYVALSDFLDCVDKLCPQAIAEEFHPEWPRQRFVLVRDLLNAMKWVGRRISPIRGIRKRRQQQLPSAERHAGDTSAMIIAGLNRAHNYDGNGELTTTPIVVSELARELGLGKSSVSRFLKAQFGGYRQYKYACADSAQLLTALKLVNGDMPPKLLLTRGNS